MINKIINDVLTVARDPERERSERVFVIFTIISEVAAFIALLGDILIGEDIREIITLILSVIAIPTITLYGVYRNKISIAAKTVVVMFVLVVLPCIYFFGGGINGGAAFWIIFALIYCGLVLSGTWRTVFLFLIVVDACLMYGIVYFFPDMIKVHSMDMFCADALISVLLVGFVCYFMTWFQNRIFSEENIRAKNEAAKAEELTRSQNRFFSSMSHEIRTPINSILGLNELILRDQSASEEIIKDASGIQGAGKMLLSLINDILDFSKIEAGSMDIVPVDYNVGDMISEIVNMIWLRAHDKGLKFNVNVDPDVPTVLYGDEVRIKQVIVNLLNNAVKYTTEGFVELQIESEMADEDHVILTITISDSGMGIKKEALPYLFDAFKRIDEENNRHIEGTGLGLSIVKQLVNLMGGTVSVNSVYGEGSTFVVKVGQGVSDHNGIGELNIHNQQTKRAAYESSFKAPDARVLIVDDNEINLEVESKLLTETGMTIDIAMSGKEALDLSIRNNYDVILMDHLMPEMDGIECLKLLRDQPGGLNRGTPVIVLTANAGSDNRELYNRAGFDDYLVKPVSGELLEGMLIKHIAKDKLILNNSLMSMREDISTASGYTGKASVIITASSVCDLPDNVVKKLGLSIIPVLVETEEGVFKDGTQMSSDELIRYIDAGYKAVSYAQNEAGYTEFFASALKKAHHLIHISLISSMSDDYNYASEAAKAFDNVTVINSGCLSSAVGLMVLIAYKLAQQNIPVNEIIEELETLKKRLRCSFVIDTTEYMNKKGFVSNYVHKAAKSLNMHPCLTFKDDKFSIGGIWMGDTKRAYRKYIKKAFPIGVEPDRDVAFITYVDVPVDTLMWIKDEVKKYADFEHIVFKQASAAVSSNCGPGTFGVLYFTKGDKSYNIGSYLGADEDEYDHDDEDDWQDVVNYNIKNDTDVSEVTAQDDHGSQKNGSDNISDASDGSEWYCNIEGIDGKKAFIHSGSEDTLRSVMKIFYETISERHAEIEKYYKAENWQDYTIKVHALKSSSKIIGAMGLSQMARELEVAGKEGNTDYIREHHEAAMEEYLKYEGRLKEVFGAVSEPAYEEITEFKPLAERDLIISAYEGLKDAAATKDNDKIAHIIKELESYQIPENEAEKYSQLREKAKVFDHAGMLKILGT